MRSGLASAQARRVSGQRRPLSGAIRLRYEDFSVLAAIADASAVVIASIVAAAAYHSFAFGRTGDFTQYVAVGVILAVMTAALMQLRGLYAPDSLLSARARSGSVLFIWTTVFLFLTAISFGLKISNDFSRGAILSLGVLAPCLILLERLLLNKVILVVLRNGALKYRRVLLIARQRSQAALIARATRSAYHIAGTHLLDVNARDGTGLGAVVSALRGSNAIDEIHLAIDWCNWPETKAVLSQLHALPIPVRLIADPTAQEILQHPHLTLGGLITFEVQRAPLRPGERAAKRLFDIVVAGLVLTLTAPFLCLVALAIAIDSPGPVLFKQRRGGFNGRAFQILKFRTMRVMEDGTTIIQAARDDPRVTRIGRWLRRLSVDELPQLINVLRGDMSLVGPRPHALAHDEQYSQLIARYAFRHHMKPGITGWAQVHGLRGETPNVDIMQRRVELDLWYVSNWSFLLDLRILLWTFLEVFRVRNAF